MTYTPENISDASERRQIPKMPCRGVVVVDALSYEPDQLSQLVGNLSLAFNIGVLVVGEETRPFNTRTNVQYVSQGDSSFAELVKEVQPDVVITNANHCVSSLVKQIPSEVNRYHRVVYGERMKAFNRQNRKQKKVFTDFSKRITGNDREKTIVNWTGYGYKTNSTRESVMGSIPVGNVVRSFNRMNPWYMVPKRDSIVVPNVMSEIEEINKRVSKKLKGARQSGHYIHFAPIETRWNGTCHTDDSNEQILGVKGVVDRAMLLEVSKEKVETKEVDNSTNKPSLLKNILDGRDAGIGIFGAGIGLATALEGLSSPQIKYGAKIGTEVVAGLVVAATAIEATVKSERIRELAGKAKKFLGSVMSFGLGVSVGMMVGGVLEMGNELVHAVGEELEFKSGWEVGGGESDQAPTLIEEKPEIVRPAEVDMSTESVATIDVKPEMTWAALTDYFEQQIIEDGGVNWVNDNGTPDTRDDVSKAQVMAHKVLIEGGIEIAGDALSAIASTSSYEQYMELRASGEIYTSVGN